MCSNAKETAGGLLFPFRAIQTPVPFLGRCCQDSVLPATGRALQGVGEGPEGDSGQRSGQQDCPGGPEGSSLVCGTESVGLTAGLVAVNCGSEGFVLSTILNGQFGSVKAGNSHEAGCGRQCYGKWQHAHSSFPVFMCLSEVCDPSFSFL